MCAKAIDIGTSFIVGAEIKDGKEVFTTERDAFFSMPNEDFAEEMLDSAGAAYVRRGNQIFVVDDGSGAAPIRRAGGVFDELLNLRCLLR